MSKRAVILAGGRGTRLRPYTVVLPKPLMPIGDYPIVEVVIRQLAAHGFDRITLAVNHQAELIKAFCGDGTRWGVAVDYSLEDRPLGTMAPLRLLRDLPDHFLLMNGDILTDFNFGDFYKEHVVHDRLFTVASHQREQQVDYGVLETDGQGRLCGFDEKPMHRYQVSMGIYMVSRAIVQGLPDTEPYGFDGLMRDLLGAGKTVHVAPFDGYWLDIGRPDDYMQAIDEFATLRHRFIDV